MEGEGASILFLDARSRQVAFAAKMSRPCRRRVVVSFRRTGKRSRSLQPQIGALRIFQLFGMEAGHRSVDQTLNEGSELDRLQHPTPLAQGLFECAIRPLALTQALELLRH